MNNNTILKTALQWGSIIGLTYLGFRFLGRSLDSTSVFAIPILAIFVLGFYLSFKQFRTQNENILSFSQGMKISCFMGLIVGLINSPYTMYIFATDSSVKMQYMREYEKVLLNILQVRGEQFEMMMRQAELLYTPTFMLITDFFATFIEMIVLGLIFSMFMQRKKSPF